MGLGRGPTNDDEEFSVSAVFKCFRKGMRDWGGPLMKIKNSLLLQFSSVLGRGCATGDWAN